jgi:hypothetical protein
MTTCPRWTVRIWFGHFTTNHEADLAVRAVYAIAGRFGR